MTQTKFKQFGRNEARILTAALNAAMKTIGDTYGVDLSVNGGRVGTLKGQLKVDVSIRADAEAGTESGDQQMFNLYCEMFGVSADKFGRKFTSRGTQYKVVGINPGARKYALEIVRVHDGKRFRFNPDAVLQWDR